MMYTTKAIAVAALMGAYTVNAQNQRPLITQPCIGDYYEAINFLQVQCHSLDGVLQSSTETYFEYSLEKICNTTTFGEVAPEFLLTSWLIPAEVTDDLALQYCDYYQRGVGYAFTVFDNNLGAVILESRRDSDYSAQYERLQEGYVPLAWKWQDLDQLITTYCAGKSGSDMPEEEAAAEMPAANWTNGTM